MALIDIDARGERCESAVGIEAKSQRGSALDESHYLKTGGVYADTLREAVSPQQQLDFDDVVSCIFPDDGVNDNDTAIFGGNIRIIGWRLRHNCLKRENGRDEEVARVPIDPKLKFTACEAGNADVDGRRPVPKARSDPADLYRDV
jgi:hypothetical protein